MDLDTPMKPPYSLACMAMILFGLSILADSGDTDDVRAKLGGADSAR
jgi:hypothetical protein